MNAVAPPLKIIREKSPAYLAVAFDEKGPTFRHEAYDLYKAQRAWDVLDVGGVVIGDVPSWRVDHMPYGGVKESGLGREGIRWAIEDMTEVRLMVVRTPPGA